MRVSDDHYKAIGRVAVASAHLEQQLTILAWMLVDANDLAVGGAALGKQPAHAVGERVLALLDARIADAGWRERLRAWVTTTRQIAEGRNATLHSAWSTTYDATTGESGSSRRWLTATGLQHEAVTLAEVQALADNAYAALAEGTNVLTITEQRLQEAARNPREDR